MIPAPSLLTPTYIGLAKAARMLPPLRGDAPVSPTTIWRWKAHGVRGPGGCTIRLRTYRVGGRTVTSVEALQEFLAALNGEVSEPATAASDRHQLAVEAKLDRARI